MAKVKFYGYGQCSTCKKAQKFLESKRIEFENIPIVERPPSPSDLKKMLGFLKGDLRKLFNTSGQLYREMGMSQKIATLSESEALQLLSKHGKLVKRPFVLSDKAGLVGFQEAEWKKVFS